MGDETWANIQLVKSKRESFREKLKRRKAERDTILSVARSSSLSIPSGSHTNSESAVGSTSDTACTLSSDEIEKCFIEALLSCVPPVSAEQLWSSSPKLRGPNTLSFVSTSDPSLLSGLLQKLAGKNYISLGNGGSIITTVHHTRLSAELEKLTPVVGKSEPSPANVGSRCGAPSNGANDSSNFGPGGKRLLEDEGEAFSAKRGSSDLLSSPPRNTHPTDDVMSLLSAPSIRERESKRVGEEILELLNKPTAREQSVAQHFRSQGGAKVREFCPRGTAEECIRWREGRKGWIPGSGGGGGEGAGGFCGKLHFRKIVQAHTDESLGDCSFLNTCFHMDSCRYVHYEVDYSGMEELRPDQDAPSTHRNPGLSSPLRGGSSRMMSPPRRTQDRTVLFPPQWIQCDLRFLDMSILGKFAVIMADPPWDIHMELPYGTMSDDEMRHLNIPALQDEGLIFLWVTGRAMELGRECLLLWGYERVDEIIWVKTNQLQRIIRTGRTGHWLNHGKEHCLVGMKGNPKINRCMDCDVIVAEVRATSHKPDEIYGIIERLSPGTRKIELFGRHHNVQPNWLTLGNQLEGVNLLEEELIRKFREHHPEGVAAKV
ncbi:N6-adenosine-methyltransferase subunit METTL3 isoform X2 [Hyalella azteca]|uniref:mRNA m(6)A methyltransferase n=1 Tax=Hyalella azteca TaxID=294128 RepID=A0A8B7PNH7_HYAAZ|nr:N6-adenosine-methyltransferase subunit METTL3 isoform X2 [Hyalella azteca]